MLERDIQRQILDYLTLRRIFHYRQNSGGLESKAGHFVRFGTPGAPDIICVIAGQYVGIEVKAPKGKLSPLQEAFGKELEAAGGRYIVARSLEDVIAAVDKQ